VLDPGRGRTKTGRLWVYARDDRPWSGADPPAAVYFYSPDRRAERPTSHLANFKGVLQVDGYPGFERLSDGGDIKLAACWSHTRRKFYEVHQATSSPIAAEALRLIAELYAIETTIRGQTAAARQSVRQSKSLPLVAAMKAWLKTQLTLIPPRSGLADAIRYSLIRWSALCSFLDDGRIELDTNTVERVIRPVALGRKNHLFAGSDGGGARWATVCSLITTAKLNEVEPFAYLKDALERMSSGHPMSRLDERLQTLKPDRRVRNGRLQASSKRPFLRTLVFFAVRTRSVLTDKFSGGGQDVVSSRALRRGFLAGAPRDMASK
jgi:transposase